MEDIEPIDLGLGDRPRKFKTVTQCTFRLEQYHIHIHTLTLWTWRPTHFEPDMTHPLLTHGQYSRLVGDYFSEHDGWEVEMMIYTGAYPSYQRWIFRGDVIYTGAYPTHR
uniref:Uncharacterized protein n=1 Tax=Vitis vinifera TaxID=29760 RepID=F6H6N5_VITVI